MKDALGHGSNPHGGAGSDVASQHQARIAKQDANMPDAMRNVMSPPAAHASGVASVGQQSGPVDSAKVTKFVSGAQDIMDQYYQRNFGNSPHMMANKPKLEVRNMDAPKYIAVDRVERYPADHPKNPGEILSRSSHAFIDRTTGDVLKPDGWKRPAKGARGNLNDEKGGLGRMGPHGPAYNKGSSYFG